MGLNKKLSFVVSVAYLALGAAVAADELISLEAMQQDVVVTNLALDDGQISGKVSNRSQNRISDVVLSVGYAWLWNDEFHPGTNNPGWATRQTLPFGLKPGESASFQIQSERTLPERDDGRFNPSVNVLSFVAFK